MSNTTFKQKHTRVLVADGDVSAVTFMSRELRKAGYDVVASEIIGVSALHAARILRPDVVVLDALLPDVDGIEIAGILHEEYIAPTVILASEVTPEMVRRAARAMVFSIMEKPTQITRLVPSIEIAMGQWREFMLQTGRISEAQAQIEARDSVERAKRVLIDAQGMSETDAYRVIRTRSMSTRQPMKEIADAILLAAS